MAIIALEDGLFVNLLIFIFFVMEGYMRVYEGIWGYMKGYKPWQVSHLFRRNISRGMHLKSCLGTPWGQSYEHICRNIYFSKG